MARIPLRSGSNVGRSKQQRDSVVPVRQGFWKLPLCVVCLMAFCLYLPSLTSNFIYDDRHQIVENPQIKSWDYLPRLLASDVWSQKGDEHVGHIYRPLFSVWMLLVYTLGGLSAWFWHLSSVTLHVLATYLAYCLCRVFLKSTKGAFWGAALYAAHPIHVDAVSWVSASNELLFTIFVLAALITMAKAVSGKGRPWLLLSVSFYAAALFAKETAVAVLPVFPMVWWMTAESPRKERDLGRKGQALKIGALYAVPTALYLIVRWTVLGRMGVEDGKHRWVEVLCSSPSILLFYLKKLLWPVGLAGFYVNPLISSPTKRMWLALAVLVVLIGLIVWLSRRFSPVFALAGTLIFLPLLPVLVAVRVYDQGNMAHDRYLYLPSVGVCLLVSFAVAKIWHDARLRPVLYVAGIGVVLSLSYLTVRQQRFYRDNEAYYERAIAVGPANTLVMGYLGDLYLENKQDDRAIEWFERGIRTAPDDPEAKFYLARGLMKMRHFSAAVPILTDLAYGSARISAQRRSAILLSLANAELELNELERAEHTLRDLNQFNSKFTGLHRTLGIVFQREGRIDEAQREYLLEFKTSGDQESGRQAIALLWRLRGKDTMTPPEGRK